jgi:hypothetical protein
VIRVPAPPHADPRTGANAFDARANARRAERRMPTHHFGGLSMTHRTVKAVAGLAFAAFAVSAAAQTNAPAAAAPPKPKCGKPAEYPGNLASDNQKRTWQKEYVAYIDCLKKFIEEQQALAEPHVKASNAAIAEYNAGVKAYNETVQKAKGD